MWLLRRFHKSPSHGSRTRSPTPIDSDGKTLIFGTELQRSIAIAHTPLYSKDSQGGRHEWGRLPIVLAETGLRVKECVDQTPKASGIFMRVVDPDQLLKLQAQFETPPKYGKKIKWNQFPPDEVPHLAAALFTKYLRSLPTPLLPGDRLPEFVVAYQCAEQVGPRATHLRYVELLRNLPFSNMYALLYVFDVLDYVSRQGNINRRRLAGIFAPILFQHHKDRNVDPALVDTLEYLTLQRDFDWSTLGLNRETVSPDPVDPIPQRNPRYVMPDMVSLILPSTPQVFADQEGQNTAREELVRVSMSTPAPPEHVPQKLLLLPSETTHIPDISKHIRRTSEEMADHGGFYAVYRGQHDNEGEVALRLPLTKRETEELERRFWREAEIWFDLRHKHISPLLGTFHDHLGHYMVSPWLKYGNVMSCIQRNTQFDQVKVLRGIADALVYLHSHGYVHGDMKMENVLLSDEGEALLTDFGLTRHFETVVTSSSLMGTAGSFPWQVGFVTATIETPDCISLSRFAPEITQGLPKSTEGDVYAFGMMISEVLTRRPPFWKHKTVFRLMNAIMDNERPSEEDIVHGQAPSCAAELWKLAVECWDVDATCRPTMDIVFDRISHM
ncbi:hypothetical protein FRB95_009514 [Tulasnella sp. JGI-2019a]|nr:hypothetical protein FRB95_009514 [Tulasnella sp. JGI-2019a]